MIIHDPGAIEARSLEIIESELTVEIPPENKAVVKRVIHATADFDYAVNLAFSDGAVEKGLAALRRAVFALFAGRCAWAAPAGPEKFVRIADVAPGVILEPRYYSTYNFTGERLPGYDRPDMALCREAASALAKAEAMFEARGLRLKIYDAYRPARAVEYFYRWSLNGDVRMKPYFYPKLDKSVLHLKGYIALRSGHSRGSAVDCTLVDMKTGRELDMGGPFDLFDERSHYAARGLTKVQERSRAVLRSVMMECGFKGIRSEWWHFVLHGEPYPDTYFEFPVSAAYLRR